MQGSRHSGFDSFVDRHPILLLATHSAPWTPSEQALQQVPWVGAGSVREDSRVLDRGTATTPGGAERRHPVHGGRRPGLTEHLQHELQRWLSVEQPGCESISSDLHLDSGVRFRLLPARPIPYLELALKTLLGCSHHEHRVRINFQTRYSLPSKSNLPSPSFALDHGLMGPWEILLGCCKSIYLDFHLITGPWAIALVATTATRRLRGLFRSHSITNITTWQMAMGLSA